MGPLAQNVDHFYQFKAKIKHYIMLYKKSIQYRQAINYFLNKDNNRADMLQN